MNLFSNCIVSLLHRYIHFLPQIHRLNPLPTSAEVSALTPPEAPMSRDGIKFFIGKLFPC